MARPKTFDGNFENPVKRWRLVSPQVRPTARNDFIDWRPLRGRLIPVNSEEEGRRSRRRRKGSPSLSSFVRRILLNSKCFEGIQRFRLASWTRLSLSSNYGDATRRVVDSRFYGNTRFSREKRKTKKEKKKEKTLETLWPRVAALSWLRYHERIVLFPPLGRELGSVLPIRNITPLFRYQPISRLEFLSLDSLFPNRRYFHHILLRLDRFLTNNYARVSNLPTIDTVCFSSFHLSPSILSQH